MIKSNYSYLRLNTSTYLLQACDEVALQMRKKAKFKGEGYPDDYIFKEKYCDIHLTHEAIGLNLTYINQLAAVLEGTLRALICEIMQLDSEKIGELSIKNKQGENYSALCRAYSIAKKYREDVEFKGGWDNLKRQFKEVFEKDINSVLTKEKTNGLNSIFILRNIAAHGTSIITPKEKLDEAKEAEYAFKWQSKLQMLNVYLKSEFNLEILDALQHPSLSYHFTEIVKEFIIAFRGNSDLPENSMTLFENLENYDFGYRNHFKFPEQKAKN